MFLEFVYANATEVSVQVVIETQSITMLIQDNSFGFKLQQPVSRHTFSSFSRSTLPSPSSIACA
ncbi:MAG: hypothetical protein RLP44_19265 [Aggregatilineales bacterium]